MSQLDESKAISLSGVKSDSKRSSAEKLYKIELESEDSNKIKEYKGGHYPWACIQKFLLLALPNPILGLDWLHWHRISSHSATKERLQYWRKNGLL